MNLNYWNRAATNYDDSIFSVWRNDRNGVLRRTLDGLADPKGVAGDLGCGSGIILPQVAMRFGTVHAIDLSPKLIETARQACAEFTRIHYSAADLSRRSGAVAKLPPLDFILNVNVLIMASRPLRESILRTLARALKPCGRLLLVVPALESVLLTNARLAEWNQRRRKKGREPRRPDKVLDHRALGEGLVKIEGVATKHYLREELPSFLALAGLQVETIEKIEYEWDTEFDVAPKWMQAPHPWDWLCLAKRTAK